MMFLQYSVYNSFIIILFKLGILTTNICPFLDYIVIITIYGVSVLTNSTQLYAYSNINVQKYAKRHVFYHPFSADILKFSSLCS